MREMEGESKKEEIPPPSSLPSSLFLPPSPTSISLPLPQLVLQQTCAQTVSSPSSSLPPVHNQWLPESAPENKSTNCTEPSCYRHVHNSDTH